MVITCEKALLLLALKSGDDPANRLVAEKIIKVAQMGQRDPEQICRRAIAERLKRSLMFASAQTRAGNFFVGFTSNSG
jgi:hypothetical protein